MFWLFHLACRDLNVIPHLMKQSKMLLSFQPILVSLRSSFSDEKTFSFREHEKPWKQLIDIHVNSG